MRHVLPFALLAFSSPLLAQQQLSDPTTQPDIVVTGQRIQDFRDALARCLARNCPPNEDADATLALAEALFLNGEYHEGREAVRASLGRNRDEARGYPEPVSDLYRAHMRLSRHLGQDTDARRSAYGILSALQEGLPQEDYRHFTARLELSEALMLSGNYNGARRELQDLQRVARAAGREDVATLAELRMLWFQNMAQPQSDARRRLQDIANDTSGSRVRSTGAKLLLARIYRHQNRNEEADALLAEIGRSYGGRGRRQLISAPRYTLQVSDPSVVSDDIGNMFPSANTLSRLSDNFEDKWIDVGFWVLPNGRVSDVEVVREDNNNGWADPLIESIRGRVYSEGPEPTYRLERYTYTAPYERITGTNIPRRSRRARVEYLDLTQNEPPEPAAGSN
jgi:tetratricopeptide (TPR) repeat protein